MPMSRAPRYRILDRLAVHRWLGAGRWRTRSKVRAFRRISMSGSPLPRRFEVETADSLHSKISWCLMAEGHLESKWLQLHYAKGHSAQSDLFWRLHFSVAICHSGVSFYFWGVLTGLDLTRVKHPWIFWTTTSPLTHGRVSRCGACSSSQQNGRIKLALIRDNLHRKHVNFWTSISSKISNEEKETCVTRTLPTSPILCTPLEGTNPSTTTRPS